MNTSTCTRNTNSVVSPLDDTNLLQHILSYVGNKQYRFVAPVNQNFRSVYLQLFNNNKSTKINASTIQHAKICIAECNHPTMDATEPLLCNSAARHGSISTLVYLRNNGYAWGESTCAMAAEFGHLRVLQYLRANGCPWDKSTCSNAARNGHLTLLQWARANGCP
jgi:hypothetical protein